MDLTTKATRLIAKILRSTINGQINWQVQDPPKSLVFGTDDFVPIFIEASYKNKHLALFERRMREYDGERDTFYWTQSIYFAILDIEDRVLWETSQSSALIDLYSTVTANAAGIDDLLDVLLDEDESDVT